MITITKDDAFKIVDIISKGREIVFCKDCRFYEKIKEDYGVCGRYECNEGCGRTCWYVDAEDFCSRGERKTPTEFEE